jgi:hypothetical protein
MLHHVVWYTQTNFPEVLGALIIRVTIKLAEKLGFDIKESETRQKLGCTSGE